MKKSTNQKPASPAAEEPKQKTEQPVAATAEPTEKEKQQIVVVQKVLENTKPEDAFKKLTRAQVELIKRTYAKGASDDELSLFIQVAASSGLSIVQKQIHLVPRWDSKAGQEVRVVVVGIDGLRSIADRTGSYVGSSDYEFQGEKTIKVKQKKDGPETELQVPEQATVTVKKVVAGIVGEFTATARWDEYYPGDSQGFQWRKMPHLMLGKCAEGLALRKAFPAQMSGMYAQEEVEKIYQEGADEQRRAHAFNQAQAALKKIADKKTLQDYRKKLNASDKYDDEQKKELTGIIDNQIKAIEAREGKGKKKETAAPAAEAPAPEQQA